MLESAAEIYLENAEPSPYMIKTFDVKEEKQDELQAVIHEGDNTTRPQTVTSDQNERYYNIIEAFEERTGVPVVLNTSFNDHGEPIVRTPRHAIRDFYSMGLDVLYIQDYRITK
jgi:carbamoyltransferase